MVKSPYSFIAAFSDNSTKLVELNGHYQQERLLQPQLISLLNKKFKIKNIGEVFSPILL